MDINEKVNVLGKAQIDQKERIDKMDSKLDLVLDLLTKQASAPTVGHVIPPEQQSMDLNVTEAILGYYAQGTLINQDGGSEHVVADPEKRRGPYKTREEALEFATQSFGAKEGRDFYIVPRRGL